MSQYHDKKNGTGLGKIKTRGLPLNHIRAIQRCPASTLYVKLLGKVKVEDISHFSNNLFSHVTKNIIVFTFWDNLKLTKNQIPFGKYLFPDFFRLRFTKKGGLEKLIFLDEIYFG